MPGQQQDLRFVASQPCAICGRSPSHAHHVRHPQSRGLGLKVSDEFTVPLCATHHHQIHTTGKEREWWQQRNIDPLIIASALWQQSRDRHPRASHDESSKDHSPGIVAWREPRQRVAPRTTEQIARLPYERVVLERSTFNIMPIAEITRRILSRGR